MAQSKPLELAEMWIGSVLMWIGSVLALLYPKRCEVDVCYVARTDPGPHSPQTDKLDALLGRELVLIGDLILTEVLHGAALLHADRDFVAMERHLGLRVFR